MKGGNERRGWRRRSGRDGVGWERGREGRSRVWSGREERAEEEQEQEQKQGQGQEQRAID